MAWAKLDDQFVEHPRISVLSDKAFRLHVASICHASRKLTDGHISETDARVLRALTRTGKRHVDELLDAGVWNVNGGNGWVIRDYLDYNPPADEVKERRKAEAERLRNLRAKRGKT
jgi:hypothetical protein